MGNTTEQLSWRKDRVLNEHIAKNPEGNTVAAVRRGIRGGWYISSQFAFNGVSNTLGGAKELVDDAWTKHQQE